MSERLDLDALLAEVRRLREERDVAVRALETIRDWYGSGDEPEPDQLAGIAEDGLVRLRKGARLATALAALEAIAGRSEGPFTHIYREAGGGYEGLQAIAREALAAIEEA